jgi:uncharacterized protein YcfJ
MTPEQIRQRRIIALAVVGVMVLGLIGWFFGSNRNAVDRLPEEGDSSDFSLVARVVGGTELHRKMNGDTEYDSLRRDLFVFAKKHYKQYESDKKVVGFEIKSKLAESDGEISFDGKYGSFSNKISVKVKLLKNERITSSITDTRTGANIDGELPSNSKRNQTIAAMPLATKEYAVSYDEDDDRFIINIYGGREPVLDAASADLAGRLGVPDLSKERIGVLRSGLSGRSLAD